jgi:hypothetical protein
LLRAILVEMIILLAIVYLPPFQVLFLTGPLTPLDWLLMFSVAPVIVIAEEVRKAALRAFVLPAPAAGAFDLPRPVAAAEARNYAPFVERAQPILVPLFTIAGTTSAAQLALNLGRHGGSRIIFLRPPRSELNTGPFKLLERDIKEMARGEVPYEYITVHRTPRKTDDQAVISSLKRVAEAMRPDMVVVPVRHNVLAGGRWAQDRVQWIEDMPDTRFVLVHGGSTLLKDLARRTYRVLIPVIHGYRRAQFRLAKALSAGSVIPDVDVVAARVVELPSSAAGFSLFRRDALAIGDESLSFITTHLSRSMQRLIRPVVLFVHHTGGDIASFARARKVDILILESKWRGDDGRILTKVERDIVAKAKCAIAVVLEPHPSNGK